MMNLTTILQDIVAGFQGALTSGEDKMKQLVTGIVWLLACVTIVSTLVLAAAGFILFGLYQYLMAYLPLPASALIVSVTALLLAVLVSGLLKRQAGIGAR
ncbi:MAG: hypothetical protein V1913_07615 [Fibrobacterota bacterium]